MAKTNDPQALWLSFPEPDRRAWTAFRRAAVDLLARLDADLLAHEDIGYSEFDALVQLSIAPEATLRMCALARAISRSPSALTRLVGRLEKRGLVARRSRSTTEVEVTLSPAGRELLARAAPRHLEQVQRYFWAPLTTRQRSQLGDLAERLLDAISAEPAPGADHEGA